MRGSGRSNLVAVPQAALLVVAAAIVLLVGGAVTAERATRAQGTPDEAAPDILLIMIDDHGYIEDERILRRLPAISETFVDGGLRLTQIYDETPLCCPARATVLSGQHTLHHGIDANAAGEVDPSVTIATAVHDAGYHTYMTGKYINGKKRFHFPPGWDHVLMVKNKNDPSFWLDDEFARFDGRHLDDVVRQYAVDWLREAPQDQPVFAYITPGAPHRQGCKGQGKADEVRECDYLPLVMEQDRESATCADIPPFKPPDYEVVDRGQKPPWSMPDWPDGWPLGSICESLLVVDRMVAELRDAQAERGRPAWFVFLSDNGMSWGRKSQPLKHVPTATRLPFYVAGPGVEPGRNDTLLSNVDLAPTLTDMAGVGLSIADGISFLPLLLGEDMAGRDEVLEIMPDRDARAYSGWAGYRTPEWRYTRWQDGSEELYDLTADPDELTDLAASQPDRLAQMRQRLEELVAESEQGG